MITRGPRATGSAWLRQREAAANSPDGSSITGGWRARNAPPQTAGARYRDDMAGDPPQVAQQGKWLGAEIRARRGWL